jgi:hypothetical protein
MVKQAWLAGEILPRRSGFFAFLTATILIAVGIGEAREWSEEVQMTHADTLGLYIYDICAVVDQRDVLHAGFYVLTAGDQFVRHARPAYQKFDQHGQALSDIVIFGDSLLANDVSGFTYDLFLDSEERVYVLWGNDTLFCSIFSPEGELIVPGVKLEGILLHNRDFGIPHGLVDSQGRITVIANVMSPPREDQWRDYFVCYGRWTEHGELIDTLHILDEGPDMLGARNPQLTITSGDTLHFSWAYRLQNRGWCYTQVSPDDQYTVNRLMISDLHPAEQQREIRSNIVVDDHNGLTVRAYVLGENRGYADYITRYLLPEFQITWDQNIDSTRWAFGPGKLTLGSQDDIHAVANRSQPELDRWLGYIRYSTNGEILDSLQRVQNMYARGRRPSDWHDIKALEFSDSSVAVMWDDGRFSDGNERGKELFIRYTLPDNAVQETSPPLPSVSRFLSAHPNPFNYSTTIKYSVAKEGRVTLKVFDLAEREVATLKDGVIRAGSYSATLQGEDLASGVYLARLDAGSESVTMKITLVR